MCLNSKSIDQRILRAGLAFQPGLKACPCNPFTLPTGHAVVPAGLSINTDLLAGRGARRSVTGTQSFQSVPGRPVNLGSGLGFMLT